MKKRALAVTIVFICLLSMFTGVSAAGPSVVLSPQRLTVNGTPISCEKYNIDGYNYFKLRDIALLLNGTEAQFSVEWDAERNLVSIVSGEVYEPNGSELMLSKKDRSRSARLTNQTIMIDGNVCDSLLVYNIGGNNYFKLRNLGDALGFTVRFIEKTNTAAIESPLRTAVESSFDVWFYDVGEGDAAMVVCDQEAMLIDGGDSGSSSLIYTVLKNNGIDRLKYIVASHGDADHVGGLAGALNYATADTALCTVTERDSTAFANFRKYLDRQDVSITVPAPGDVFSLGSAAVTVLYPSPDQQFSQNTSLVLQIRYRDYTFLFVGDCQAADEEYLLSHVDGLESTVLKIGHHGSSTSSTYAFLDRVKPEYAVISVGGDNPYGHPHEEVLNSLRFLDVSLFRTDMHGDIHCFYDDGALRFVTEKQTDSDPFDFAGGWLNARQETVSDGAGTRGIPAVGDCDYVVNMNSRIFHLPDCQSVSDMAEHNKLPFTGTREELIEQGYQPCKRCNP